MDQATTAIIAPWAQLGIVGSVVLALSVVVILQWRRINEVQAAHLAEVKACSAQTVDLVARKLEGDHRMADALEGLERVVETALAALRK